MKTLNVIAGVLISGALCGQSTHTVDNSPSSGAQFTSLQAAINAATTGDTLYIHPSTVEYGNITLSKTLHLRGMAHASELANAGYAKIGNITLNAPFGTEGFTLEGLRFNYMNVSSSGGVNNNNAIIKNCKFDRLTVGNGSIQCDGWIVSGNVISDLNDGLVHKQHHDSWVIINNHFHHTNTSPGFSFLYGANGTDLIRNNIFISNQTGALQFCQNCVGAVVENSLLFFNAAALSISPPVGQVSFSHSLTYNYLGGTMAALNGNDNLDNVNPNFVNATNADFSYAKDFHIQEGTAAYDAGSDGTELGIHGNDYSFDMRGYADDLPYPTSLTISNSVIPQGGTLNVTFEAESN